MPEEKKHDYAQPVRQLELTDEFRRDLFAGFALAGMLAQIDHDYTLSAMKLVAIHAYGYADACMEARKQ